MEFLVESNSKLARSSGAYRPASAAPAPHQQRDATLIGMPKSAGILSGQVIQHPSQVTEGQTMKVLL